MSVREELHTVKGAKLHNNVDHEETTNSLMLLKYLAINRDNCQIFRRNEQ